MSLKKLHYSVPASAAGRVVGMRALCAEAACLKVVTGDLTGDPNRVTCTMCRDIYEARLTQCQELAGTAEGPLFGDVK